MIDHTETFKTMGFCPTCARYTAHVCAKCQPPAPAPTPDPQAEIARLTAERDALRNELDGIVHLLKRNITRTDIPSDVRTLMSDIVLVTTDILSDGA